nr:PREDICTED: alpha-tocopherol transfer protein-like isoform X1 [Bemisia tabaci]XP_018897499.1 PREDICTED: alpha-tocopherol transfer protein-like isoform X2 [Bemisia tabaci]
MTPRASVSERVRREFNMSSEGVRRDVEHLKSWLRAQPHLPPLTGVNEDIWLENYLILNKNRVERACKNLELYFKCRSELSELFTDRDPHADDVQKSFKSTCLATVPELNEKGERVFIYAHFTSRVSAFEVIPLGKRLFAMIDIYLKEGIDRTGSIIICDLHNTRLGHLTRYPLKLMKRAFEYGWTAYPERVRQIHIINPPPYLQAVLTLFRPFLKEKIKNRIKVHSKLSSLHQMVPKSQLPSDYGGECASLKELNDDWIKKMTAHREWLAISGTQHKPKELEKSAAAKNTSRHEPTENLGTSFKDFIID